MSVVIYSHGPNYMACWHPLLKTGKKTIPFINPLYNMHFMLHVQLDTTKVFEWDLKGTGGKNPKTTTKTTLAIQQAYLVFCERNSFVGISEVDS